MIFTKIELDNIYCFHNTCVDLTYPRKVKDSSIENERLIGRENFYYKKICIISGANASGKTTFGKVLCSIQNFIKTKQLHYLNNSIYDTAKSARFIVEFATVSNKNYRLHQLNVTFAKQQDKAAIKQLEYASVFIAKHDSVTKTRKKLKDTITNKKSTNFSQYIFIDNDDKSDKYTDIKNVFSSLAIHTGGWKYQFSHSFENNDFSELDKKYFPSASLNKILKSFDSSIRKVSKLIEEDSNDDEKDKGESYSIVFTNGDRVLLDNEGNLTNPDRLSKGTVDAIEVARFYTWVTKSSARTFYLDEKLAYSHSEMEQSIVNLIIQKLPDNAQFFYTTHNYDILDLNLPTHSYLFFKKEGDNCQIIQPELTFKKNDRSLLNYIKNDAFSTLPDTANIDALLFEDN